MSGAEQMPDKNTQKDAGLAEEQRPRPSQAEGEEEPGSTKGAKPVPSRAEGEERQ